MKIGVFDSGNGGYTTLGAIRSLLPENEYYYIGDHKNCPYGTKTQAELIEITTHIAQRLASWGAEMIVIACNTATTRCIRALRQRFPDIIFVGTEPAIKLACDADCQEILLPASKSSPIFTKLNFLTVILVLLNVFNPCKISTSCQKTQTSFHCEAML